MSSFKKNNNCVCVCVCVIVHGSCWSTVVYMQCLHGHHMLSNFSVEDRMWAQVLPAATQRSVRYGNPPAFMNDTRPAL